MHHITFIVEGLLLSSALQLCDPHCTGKPCAHNYIKYSRSRLKLDGSLVREVYGQFECRRSLLIGEILTQVFVISCLERWDVLLSTAPPPATRPAAGLQCCCPSAVQPAKVSHRTPLLCSLHWIPVAAQSPPAQHFYCKNKG